MNISYHGEASASKPSYVLDSDGVHMVYGLPGTTAVEVVSLHDLTASPLQLWSDCQTREISALCLGSSSLGTSDPLPGHHDPREREETLLCSASRDAVVIWSLASAFAAQCEGRPLPEPTILITGQGQVDAIAFGGGDGQKRAQQAAGTDTLLVVCAGAAVHVFQLPSLENVLRLEAHAAPVLSACFCSPFAPNQLVTAGEDRTFKVWDLLKGELLYQSSILTASPLTSIAIDPSFPRMAVGAADGVVRFFDLSSLPSCRSLQTVDVARQLQRIADVAATAAAAAAQSSDIKGSGGPKVVRARKNPHGTEAMGLHQDGGDSLGCDEAGEDEEQLQVSTSGSVSKLYYSPLRASMPSGETGLIGESPKLLVGTTRALAVMDSHTYTLVEAYFYRGGGALESRAPAGASGQGTQLTSPSNRGRQSQYQSMWECSLSGAYSFSLSKDQQFMYCCAAEAYGPNISVLRLTPALDQGALALAKAERLQAEGGAGWSDRPTSGRSHSGGGDEASDDIMTVSVFQSRPLPDSSPLKAQPIGDSSSSSPALEPSSSKGSKARSPSPVQRTSSSGGPSSTAAPASKWAKPQTTLPPINPPRRSNSTGSAGSGSGSSSKVTANLPVTFNRKIKSSGYGVVQPQIRMGRAPPVPVKITKTTATSAVARHLLQQRQYPVDCGPLVLHQAQNVLPGGAKAHGAAITKVLYSSDSSRLLTTGADRTARVMKLPLHKYQGEGSDLISHNAAVVSGDWSHDGTLILTASSDRTAKLWNAACAQPLLEFSHINAQSSKAPAGMPPTPGSKSNSPYVGEVRAARFFYLDAFILLATGNKLLVYRYKLCGGDKMDDIEKLRNNNRYRLAGSYSTTAQAIHDFSCVNSFLSPLALLALSNRAIEVLDVATMQCVSTIEDAHARPVHTIVQSASASLFTSHPREACELFVTSAQDSAVKLWDVRVSRCVRTFSGHKSSQIPTGVAFSPCLRYVASGSEDKVAYMYDMRMGTLLHRIGKGVHGDAVVDIAFSPLHPQIATACLDGKVHFFSEQI